MVIEYDATTKMAMRLSTALVRAIKEHGAPNSFGFAELVGAKDAMFAGKAVRRLWVSFCANVASRLPPEFEGAHVNLSGGRLFVTTDAQRRRRA